jgi:hypothetical protein
MVGNSSIMRGGTWQGLGRASHSPPCGEGPHAWDLGRSASWNLRQFPRLMLILDQPFQRLCDLAFLIALSSGRQRPSFLNKLRSGLDQLAEIEKVG